MKVREPYKCDYCPEIKKPGDPWWLRSAGAIGFYLMRWEPDLAAQDGYEHICSQACAMKALDKWASASNSLAVGASLGDREKAGA